jgi:hypothetical protein
VFPNNENTIYVDNAVPEPATLAIVLCGMTVALSRRRK